MSQSGSAPTAALVSTAPSTAPYVPVSPRGRSPVDFERTFSGESNASKEQADSEVCQSRTRSLTPNAPAKEDTLVDTVESVAIDSSCPESPPLGMSVERQQHTVRTTPRGERPQRERSGRNDRRASADHSPRNDPSARSTRNRRSTGRERSPVQDTVGQSSRSYCPELDRSTGGDASEHRQRRQEPEPVVSPAPATATQTAELAELKAQLAREALERRRLEVLQEQLSSRLVVCEVQANKFAGELNEVKHQRDSLRRQLKDKSDKYSEVVRKAKSDEVKRGHDEVIKAGLMQRELDARVKREKADKGPTDGCVRELQTKLRQFEQDMASLTAKSTMRADSPLEIEAQLELMRRQLEETARTVRCRHTSNRHGSSISFDTDKSSTSQTQTGGGVTASSDAEMLSREATGADEEEEEEEQELPTEERLIGEWNTVPGELLADVEVDLSASSMHRASSAPSIGGQSAGSGPTAGPSSPATPITPGRPSGGRQTEEWLPNHSTGSSTSTRNSTALSLRDLSEIRTLKKPPPPIRMLMEVCCLLFHIRPIKQPDESNCKKMCHDYWEPARRYLLSDPFFPSKLRAIDATQFSQAQRAKIRRYFRDPEFTAERVRNCSVAAHALYDWVRVLIEQDATPRQQGNSTAVARQFSDSTAAQPGAGPSAAVSSSQRRP